MKEKKSANELEAMIMQEVQKHPTGAASKV